MDFQRAKHEIRVGIQRSEGMPRLARCFIVGATVMEACLMEAYQEARSLATAALRCLIGEQETPDISVKHDNTTL